MKFRKIFVCLCFVFVALLGAGCNLGNFEARFGTNITEYDMKLELSDKSTLKGKQTTNFKNTTANILNDVCFHLYPNSFADVAINKPVSKLYESKAYPNGFSSGKIEILSVKALGENCVFVTENLDKDILKVQLNNSLYPNDFVKIEMSDNIDSLNVAIAAGILMNFYK